MAFTIPFKPSARLVRNAGYAALAVGALALSWFRVFEIYELQTYDWRCQIRGQRPVHPDIAIIEIEEITLENIGKWPFDRQYHAQLIDRLNKIGAQAVIFDILFVEPSPADALMADLASAAGNVYFAEALSEPVRRDGAFVSAGTEAALLPSLSRAAKGIGYVNVQPDVDGKRRKIYPTIRMEGDGARYHLSLRAALDVLGVPPADVRERAGRLELGKRRALPLTDDGHFLVNYAGQWRRGYPHYSYVQVLYAYEQMQEGEKPIIDLSRLKGKICFVGLSALGSHDTSPVPIQAVYPMMGLYANVLNSILLEDYLWRLGRAGNLLIVLVLGAWILYASSRLKPLRALLAVLATVAAFSGAAVAAFFWTGLWVDLFYPLTLFTVIYAASTLTRTLFEIRKRELIEGELKIASKIQKSFLPETLPQVPGIQFEVFMKPAKHVGGDLYAFIPLPEGRIGVMLGDVSGKGTPAALFMAKVVSEFKFSARDKSDPAQVLTALNNSIASESTGGLFVTLTYVIFDMPNKKLLLANGGHLPTVHVGPGGDGLISGEEGMPIGVMEGVSFSNLERGIADGDCFALYSDGVSEARNRRKDEYGVETLQAQMARRRGGTAKEILDGAVADLQRFTAKADQHDDITLLIIRVGNP